MSRADALARTVAELEASGAAAVEASAGGRFDLIVTPLSAVVDPVDGDVSAEERGTDLAGPLDPAARQSSPAGGAPRIRRRLDGG